MKIARDKQLHIGSGMALALVTIWFGFWVSLAVVLCAAVGKEAYDYLHPDKHTCDVWDAVATVAGALPVWAIAALAGWLG